MREGAWQVGGADSTPPARAAAVGKIKHIIYVCLYMNCDMKLLVTVGCI